MQTGENKMKEILMADGIQLDEHVKIKEVKLSQTKGMLHKIAECKLRHVDEYSCMVAGKKVRVIK